MLEFQVVEVPESVVRDARLTDTSNTAHNAQTPQIRHLTTAWTKLRPTICVCEVQSSSISIDGEIPFIMHSTAGTLVSLKLVCTVFFHKEKAA